MSKRQRNLESRPVTHADTLSGRRILLGVTGSIAAYKSIDLLRRLQERGAEVRVAMTRNAARFVSPLTFETLSHRQVLCDEFSGGTQPEIGHISITDNLDLALIAPATANIIGKAAAGIADDALSTALLALECPLLMAPSMNDRMYRSLAVQSNIRILQSRGVRFLEPETGKLACGTIGQGRLADMESILHSLASIFSKKDLTGVSLLITAGPTREPIDAVRFISNPSTGKMGYALATVARDRGANVLLVTGPVHITPPRGVRIINVTTAEEMRRVVRENVAEAHVVIMSAAVSDFKPVISSDRKIKKESASLALQLERTTDILQELGSSAGRGKRILVGFAAETDDVLQHATKKLQEKNLDIIVANDLTQTGSGFGSDNNSVTILEKTGGKTEIPLKPKEEIAAVILDKIVELKANKGFLP